MRPVDMPKTPSSMAWARMFFISSSSYWVGERFSKPNGKTRMLEFPTRGATFSATPFPCRRFTYSLMVDHVSSSSASSSMGIVFRMSSLRRSLSGAAEPPQFPMTSVVTPCRTLLSARGFTNSSKSE